MTSFNFSEETRKVAERAEKTVASVIAANRRDFDLIPAQYHDAVRHLIRAGHYAGYSAGIDRTLEIAK